MHNRIAHAVAGTFILTSLTLGLLVSKYWFILTGFVGLNLLQNSFTNWCFLSTILHKIGVEDTNSTCNTK